MIDLRRWRYQSTLESRGDVVDDELRKLVAAPIRKLKHQRNGMPIENEDQKNFWRQAVVPLPWTGSTVQAVVPLGMRAVVPLDR